MQSTAILIFVLVLGPRCCNGGSTNTLKANSWSIWSSIVVFTDGPLKDSLCAQPLVINIPLGENAFTRVDTDTLAVRIGTNSMLTFHFDILTPSMKALIILQMWQ